MNESMQFNTRVGDDGVLKVNFNLGPSEARKDVVVTVQPLIPEAKLLETQQLCWEDFIELTYGSCAGLGLERQEQGDFEHREQVQ